jgi:uncharacterized damage-inducible protein DinB
MKMSAAAHALKPDASEYAPFYEAYVSLVPEGDVVEAMRSQLAEVTAMLGGISEERGGYAYAEGKWSIRQVVGHCIDGERIFSYRALAIARGEQRPLPGMDQDEYMAHSNFDSRTLADLAAEFAHARAANVLMFQGLSEDAWLRRGTASEREVSVRALAHIVVGHVAHHMNVLRARYL